MTLSEQNKQMLTNFNNQNVVPRASKGRQLLLNFYKSSP